MALYLISIIGGDALIFLLNFLFNKNTELLQLIIWAVLSPVILIAWDGIIATFIRRCLPNKWYDYKVSFRKVSKKECRFYDFLHIKSWKDKVLELGVFTSFSKKNIADPHSREYIERFILESNYGWSIHLWNAVLGFAVIFIFPSALKLSFGIPVCIINFILSILPFMILRYNSPRLYKIRDILEKKENRQ